MDMNEYRAWMAETKKSETQWNFDFISWHNKKEILAYTGGVNGQYVSIEQNGEMQIGTYEGAYPHIGEAIFKRRAHKKYQDFNEALTRAIEIGGMTFLVDFLTKGF